MAAGGSVTAIDPFPSVRSAGAVAADNNQLYTTMGVKPGDQLVMSRGSSDTALVTVRAPIQAGASDYDVITTCGSGSLQIGGSGTPNQAGVMAVRPRNRPERSNVSTASSPVLQTWTWAAA